MKEDGLFVKISLDPKLMDRKTSMIALGGDLLSAEKKQRHEAERMAATKTAKSAKSSKDKGKSVDEDPPKKKPSVPTQAPREKLLGSSFAAEKARLSRESKTDSGKRKREL
ncbi:hypothetical protein R1sor_027445 [Riccia sorocarpa]|uniref:Uncharacterized protein n=1 Tax=Riccia sorocarpa TaxID=122646 RepID=A0ABD3GH29_9MARC